MPGEFTKLVYDSKFKKCTEEMSFVNSKPRAFPGQSKQDFGGSREIPTARWSGQAGKKKDV